MGVCCNSISRNSYLECSSEEDAVIRNWEESKLRMNFNTFKSVQLKCQFLNRNESYILAKLAEIFSKELSDIVSDSQYFKSEKTLDLYKISALNLLLSRDSISNSKEKVSDKAIYLYQEILSEIENEINSPIEKHNQNLRKLFNTLIDITFDVLLPAFLRSEKVEKSSYNKYTSVDKKKLLEQILDNMFFKQDKNNQVFTFEELNKLFINQKWILSTGYLRECLEKIGN